MNISTDLQHEQLARLLPDDLDAWKKVEPDGYYTADNLFELIDGGAEVYRALKVQKIVSRRFASEDGPEILADIFAMASPADAFGAYHHDMREGESKAIGRESEYLGTNLAFWKNRYFVSIIALDESDAVEAAVLALGRAIAEKIPDQGEAPDLIKLLPSQGLSLRQVHYFHEKNHLDCYCFLSDKNLLSLDKETEGVVARYKASTKAQNTAKKSPTTQLLLVRYPDKERARKATARFISAYLPDADGEGHSWKRLDCWAGAQLMETILVVVLDAPSAAEVDRLMQGVKKRINR